MKIRSITRYLFRFSVLLAFILFSHLKLTIAGPGPDLISNSESSGFDYAAQRNSHLKADLQWSFGGRSQRGWYLYSPLVCGLLGVECETDSHEFAQALYNWQQSAGLEPTGILDRETWMSMVARFQAARIKQPRPSSDDLIQVPASDFYDPKRPAELRMVERRTYAAYKLMVEAAVSELSPTVTTDPGSADNSSIPYLKIVSAYRSPAYQAQLRRRSPQSGRAGLALKSPHSTGCALDLYVGGDPVNTADHNRSIQIDTAAYRWLVKNAHRFGFYPYFYEPWHWEYRLNGDVQGGKHGSKHTNNH